MSQNIGKSSSGSAKPGKDSHPRAQFAPMYGTKSNSPKKEDKSSSKAPKKSNRKDSEVTILGEKKLKNVDDSGKI